MDMNIKKEIGENPVEDLVTMEQVFAKTLKIGQYTFKLKEVKGKDLFILINTFGFSGSKIAIKNNGKDNEYEVVDGDTMKEIFEQFGENFDLFMSYLQFSVNGKDYIDLVINDICQVGIVETNIAVMYQLMFFVYQAVMLFMQISQQQSKDMK